MSDQEQSWWHHGTVKVVLRGGVFTIYKIRSCEPVSQEVSDLKTFDLVWKDLSDRCKRRAWPYDYIMYHEDFLKNPAEAVKLAIERGKVVVTDANGKTLFIISVPWDKFDDLT